MSQILSTVHTRHGTRFVLIEDEVAEQPEHEDLTALEPATDFHDGIWARIEYIRRAREANPNTLVFGFWQTLLTSGLIPKHANGVAVSDDGFTTGYFAYLSEGRVIETGSWYGGALEHAMLDLESCHQLGPEILDQLVLPKNPAVLPDELGRIERRRRQVAMFGAVGSLLAVFVVAVAADQLLALRARHISEEAKRINAQADAIDAESNALEPGANPILPADVARYRAVLSRMAELVETTEGAKSELTPLSGNQDVTYIVDKVPTLLSYPSLIAARPGKPLTVTVSLDGSAAPVPPPEPQ